VQLYAFDCLAFAGDDLRRLPLHLRKTNLMQLLRGRSQGIFVAPFEAGKIGPDLFDAACRMGLEGLVSKHRERAYRIGRCDHWIKVKNRRIPHTAGLWVRPEREVVDKWSPRLTVTASNSLTVPLMEPRLWLHIRLRLNQPFRVDFQCY